MDSKAVTINDPVHNTIEVHPLCLKIIDTPEFQRLRDIKQCGMSYLVYPSAVHTRFEHSIGVYHLAQTMTECLMKRYAMNCEPSEENNNHPIITKEEQLCVMIAALCHDIGHGPFSHLWERFVNGKISTTAHHWRHEDMSNKIFKHLIEKNKLKDEFYKYNLNDSHIDLIMDIIAGNHDPHKDKLFLFEIVANKKTNIDVDRWDYMMRDAYFFGILCPVEYRRILSYIKIRKTPEGNRIEFRDKLKDDLLEIFKYRLKLHKICYQHRVCKNIEQMLIDALLEADEFFFNERELSLCEAHNDIETFLSLSDGLLFNILNSNNEKLKKSKDLLLRIIKRDLYQLILENNLKHKLPAETVSRIKGKLEDTFQTGFKLVQAVLSMGVEGNDPFKNVLFFSKNGCEIKPSLTSFCQTEEIKLYIFSVNKLDEERVEKSKALLAEEIKPHIM